MPLVVCYICGREFSTASLPIHEPKCLEKWKIENDKLPKRIRRPLPVKPSTAGRTFTKSEANKIAYEVAKQQQVKCGGCSRTFAPDRLAVHERVCMKDKPDNPYKDEGSTWSAPKSASKSRLLVCYICGREFGSKSLPIHEPKCLEKWKIENAKLPKRLQRAEPVKPELAEGDTVTKETVNAMAYKTAQSQLVKCRGCHRTFAPDRLPVHERACMKDRPDSPYHSEGSQWTTPSRPPAKSKLVFCYICGREFGTKSLSIHEPQCLVKWRTENNKLPPDRRREEPVRPDRSDADFLKTMKRSEYNSAAQQTAAGQLLPCENCGRTFQGQDRLDVHQRACRPGQPLRPARGVTAVVRRD